MHSAGIFSDQSPDALRLTVAEGELDRTQFDLLGEDSCELWGMRISATVIGASHIVTFETLAFTLNEIFACVTPVGYASWPLETILGHTQTRDLPGMHYEFCSRLVPWQDDEPEELTSIVTTAKSGIYRLGVIQDFPQGDLPAIPKTVIVGSVDLTRRGVVIETAHSYPGQGLVLSRSTLYHT